MMETADSHNRRLTGSAEPAYRPTRPIYPHGAEETLSFRWGRDRIGFHREPKWLDVVRDAPCIACGAPGPSDPHHVYGSQGSLKTSDLGTIPLCRGCHERVENDRAFKNQCAVMLGVFIVKKLAEAKGLK